MNFNILFNEATNFHLAGDLVNAEKYYLKFLEHKHRNFDVHLRLAILYSQMKNSTLALKFFDKSLSINPLSSEALFNRAILFEEIDQPKKALIDIDKSLLIDKYNHVSFLIKGNAQKRLGDFIGAIKSYTESINLNSAYHEAYCNRGVIFKELRKYSEALEDFNVSISINPLAVDAYTNRAATFIDLKRFDNAMSDLQYALNIRPDFDDALYNLATLYKNLKLLNDAINTYKKVLDINPLHIESAINLSIVLQEASQLDSAYSYFLRALEIEPEFRFNTSTFLSLKNKLCFWDNFDEDIKRVIYEINHTKKIVTPFHLLGLIDRPDLHLIACKNYVSKECPPNYELGQIVSREFSGKIRLAYYSADFYNHATTYLMAELFELHDKEKFELFAFSFGPNKKDEMHERVIANFDNFIDVTNLSDLEVAQLSRRLMIDIAVDLKGYTQDCRPNIFAMRCAPIQISYLGYPGTLGSDYMDYIIADEIVIPKGSQKYYTEKVIYLPNSYQVNDSKRLISNRIFTKKEVKLPENGFVFCCFNNCYKITPYVFEIWMEMLHAVPDSVLWLLDDNSTATKNLINTASAKGIQNNRLIFAERMRLEEHLARHRVADLFLDTTPYNAHTTASDALWTGLPVLTFAGESFASRVGASLLNAIQIPELITYSLQDYKASAIKLATDPHLLQEVKKKLIHNISTSPLFNSALFTKQIEEAYINIFETHLKD